MGDQHKDVPWSGHKCQWKNCHECAECTQDARMQNIISAQGAVALHQNVRNVNATTGSLDEESKKKALHLLWKKAKRTQAKKEAQTLTLEEEDKNIVVAPKTGIATKKNRKAEEKTLSKAERKAKRKRARAER